MHQGRLVALDKQPGIRPLGIGEAWMRAVSKLILMQCGRDGKAACGNTQLCTGLKARIKGTIHISVQRATTDNTLCFQEDKLSHDTTNSNPPNNMNHPDTDTQLPQEGFPDPTQADPNTMDDPEVHFLMDARNGFGELSHMAMLWEA